MSYKISSEVSERAERKWSKWRCQKIHRSDPTMSALQVPWFDSQSDRDFFCLEFACSHNVFVGFLLVLPSHSPKTYMSLGFSEPWDGLATCPGCITYLHFICAGADHHNTMRYTIMVEWTSWRTISYIEFPATGHTNPIKPEQNSVWNIKDMIYIF